jgi:hypothetical protein
LNHQKPVTFVEEISMATVIKNNWMEVIIELLDEYEGLLCSPTYTRKTSKKIR